MTAVTKDLFGIARRLGTINPLYRVFYNSRANRFEVHARGHIAFIVPYDRLDVRTLDYARKTRIQNADVIEEEISQHNAKLQNEIYDNLARGEWDLMDKLAFANRTGHNVTFTKNYLKEF